MATRLPDAARNAAADGVVDLADAGAAAGTAEIYSGAQPASAGDAATGTLLATVTLADPAFGAAAAGVATATDPAAVTVSTSGTAGWFRVKDSNGNTCWDGDVTGTGGGGDMEVDDTALVAGGSFDITSWTVTMPAG